MKFAVLTFTDPSADMQKLIDKAGAILGRNCNLATTMDSEMNMRFYVAHKGSKELYSELPAPETGVPIPVNPTFGNLRKQAMRDIKGFMKLKPRHRSLAYSTLACIYGLEGKASPVQIAKFVVVCTDPTSDHHEDHLYCVSLVRSLGIKIIDLADSKGRTAFVTLLKRLSAK